MSMISSKPLLTLTLLIMNVNDIIQAIINPYIIQATINPYTAYQD